MTEMKFNELATKVGKKVGPLQRIVIALMFFVAPGFTLVTFAKDFFQKWHENYDDYQIKKIMETIRNA